MFEAPFCFVGDIFFPEEGLALPECGVPLSEWGPALLECGLALIGWVLELN